MADGGGAAEAPAAGEEAPAAGGQEPANTLVGPNQQAVEPPQYVEMSLDGRFGRVRSRSAWPSLVGEP
jgi:hypothetical protein